jgi:hypothetical protein
MYAAFLRAETVDKPKQFKPLNVKKQTLPMLSSELISPSAWRIAEATELKLKYRFDLSVH